MIERVVKECLGVPYVHGGRDLTGFDCLGLVWYFYNRLGINIPDGDGKFISAEWYIEEPDRLERNLKQLGVAVNLENGLEVLDLLYFAIAKGVVSHLGILVSENMFIHCMENRPVGLDRIDRPFWKRRLVGARRVV